MNLVVQSVTKRKNGSYQVIIVDSDNPNSGGITLIHGPKDSATVFKKKIIAIMKEKNKHISKENEIKNLLQGYVDSVDTSLFKGE